MKNIIVIIISVFTFTVAQGQEKGNSTVETTFKVEGVCNMCKERIEGAALRTKGVKFAEWNKETEDLKVIYNSKKTDEKAIHQAVADKGHETAMIPVDSTKYNKLPACCQYKHGAKCHD